MPGDEKLFTLLRPICWHAPIAYQEVTGLAASRNTLLISRMCKFAFSALCQRSSMTQAVLCI